MSALRIAIVFTLSFLLMACSGGGGGDSPKPTGNTVAISPDTASINAGQVLPLRITGGAGPYYLTTSNPQTLPVVGAINNIYSADLTVTAGDVRETETVTITVTDKNGSSAKAAITVNYITMSLSPSALSLASTKTQTFTLYGGKAPFTVTTTRPDLLVLDTGGLSGIGKTFSIFANNVTAQVSDIGLNVADAAGNTVSSIISLLPIQLFDSVQVEPSGSGNSTVGAITAGQSGVVRIQTSASVDYPVPRTITVERISGSFALDSADSFGRVALNVGEDHVALATLTASVGAMTQTGILRVTDNATGAFVDSDFQIAGSILSAAPSAISALSSSFACKTGTVGVVQIMGGVPPYTILSTSQSLITATPAAVSQSGGTITLAANGVCTSAPGVGLTITDAAGAQTFVTFTSVGLSAN